MSSQTIIKPFDMLKLVNHFELFHFSYPVKTKLVKREGDTLKVVHKLVGELLIEVEGDFNPNASLLDMDNRYTVKITKVIYKDACIMAILEAFNQMDAIYEQALRLFTERCPPVAINLSQQIN